MVLSIYSKIYLLVLDSSQSYLIHLRFVTRVKDDEVFLNKERIHISRGSKKELIRALAEYTANG